MVVAQHDSPFKPDRERKRAMVECLDDLRFRPIGPEDLRRLQAFHRRLSPSTVRLRFHGAKGELSTPLAQHFTNLDGQNNAAIVATTGTRGRIIGVARYDRIDATRAEVAFVVEDEYQGHGVGRRLMHRLRDHAQHNGITELVAEVMGGNAAMFHLLREAGETHSHALGGEVEVTVDLAERH